jgi:8-oxo-dGTP pyrophosphatase MutT (NUDIX family)
MTRVRKTKTQQQQPAPGLAQIRRALGRRTVTVAPLEGERKRASVALILAGAPEALHLCFIRRAEHPRDPWSGHMAFPGGRADPTDPHAQAVAERETREEVGLRLPPGRLIAPLAELPVRLGQRDTGMTLSSFVYYLGPRRAPLRPNSEVAGAYWVPLTHLWDAAHATHLKLRRDGESMLFAAIRFQDTVIWGLTLRVLTMFSDDLEHPLPHLEDIPGMVR